MSTGTGRQLERSTKSGRRGSIRSGSSHFAPGVLVPHLPGASVNIADYGGLRFFRGGLTGTEPMMERYVLLRGGLSIIVGLAENPLI